jgi:predicted flap endonuclease-1-like 5' DNA nuclease
MTPSTPASAFLPATIVGLIFIGIAMVVVIGAMIYGSRLARLRHQAMEIEDERAEEILKDAPPPPPVDENGLPRAPLDNEAAATPTPAPAEPAEKAAAMPALQDSAPAPAPEGALPLTTIKGLGPKVAGMLAELGVTGVDQIAALSPADADALDAKLGAFTGRMARDRWIEQARLLTAGDRTAYEAEFGKLG